MSHHTIVVDFPLEAVRLVGRVSNLAQNEIRLILVDIIVPLEPSVSAVYTPSILVDPAPHSHLPFGPLSMFINIQRTVN